LVFETNAPAYRQAGLPIPPSGHSNISIITNLVYETNAPAYRQAGLPIPPSGHLVFT